MACTTILVGKKASYDGSTMIARNDDSHQDILQRRRWLSCSHRSSPSNTDQSFLM